MHCSRPSEKGVETQRGGRVHFNTLNYSFTLSSEIRYLEGQNRLTAVGFRAKDKDKVREKVGRWCAGEQVHKHDLQTGYMQTHADCVWREPGEGDVPGLEGLRGEKRGLRNLFHHLQVQCPVWVPAQPPPCASTQPTSCNVHKTTGAQTISWLSDQWRGERKKGFVNHQVSPRAAGQSCNLCEHSYHRSSS